jgi:two-component system nitrate/nitrite response regulator NarL
MTRILLADGQPFYLGGMAGALRRAPGFEVVAEVCDGTSVAPEILRLAPEVAVVDGAMRGFDLRRIIAIALWHRLPTRVVLLVADSRPGRAYAALEAGVRGYLARESATPTTLQDALRSVARGGTAVAPDLMDEVVEDIRMRERQRLRPPHEQEGEILGVVANGRNGAAGRLTAP